MNQNDDYSKTQSSASESGDSEENQADITSGEKKDVNNDNSRDTYLADKSKLKDPNSNLESITPLSEVGRISIEDIEKKFENIELTFVQKINALEAENIKLEKQIKFYFSSHEKLLSLVDQQNYLNRLIKRITDEKKFSAQSLASKILKPIDWIEKTLQSIVGAEADNSWVKGLSHIHERFIVALSEESITAIDINVGDVFDHTICNAIEQVESDEYAPKTIVKVHEKGYYLHDRVLRHAAVIVAKPKIVVTPLTADSPVDKVVDKE